MGPREADSEGEAKDHKTPGTAWCRGQCPTQGRSLCCHTVRRRREEANLHLQTSQQQTRGQADRQTPRPLPKQPDIQTETTEGKPSEPLISTTKRQGWGGQRGGQPQESTKKTKKTRTNNRTRHRSKPTNKGGQGQARPTTRATKHTRDATTTNKKPQRPTTEAKGKGKCHENRPRESHQGKTYQGTLNMSFEWKRGQTTSLNVRLTIETEEPNTAKSRIARGKSSPLRSETRQGGGKGRGGGRGSLRHTEHCIILVELFVVLDCVGPAVLEGKGN